ncbi:4-amino-4-deoxy-L-arabinose transferase [Lentzea albidocapillata subsp. violacea]|uniref:4-amino-4-deoxy-L-arabinose transferase n=1 Tax=Lentzea albidocapillata subsp. violacea TaxID=128104 RepID=A0A1G8XLM7_9PSEU|nr:glycosyltransferase family 39 protein [Lentzea albidocapillata]SDJ90690.1 4-amino-4-deoxy-L-arabinose transferase [Lentzea albidocapillata subsp. violacea]
MTATTEARAGEPITARSSRWHAWALVAICVAAGALYVWAIGAGQVGNPYYAAAAKSMTTSFTDFLFGSFDPAGVVTVDKPPMSLWPQAVAVWIFGFHGWVVLLPQVVEGVAAVFLLHRTVRLWADEEVALLAALIFALTPITVAINRDNNPDTLLVLLLVAAAYAFTRSVQATESRPRTKWLLWCAFFIGCGFLTKMLQAWIVVPGFALAYLVGTSAPVKRRILDLLAAGGVLVVSSFWWVALHAWWPGSKPYVGGSTDGGAWDLIIGYNGLGRVFGGSGNRGGGGQPAEMEFAGPRGGAMFGGEPGITRMFDSSVGGQISWLLPLCLLVLVTVAVAGVLRWRRGIPGDPAERAGWFMWGSWLLVTAAVFSFAQGIFHPYYTTMLAPPVAAISAAGLAMFWRARSFVRFLLPLSVAITAAWAIVVVSRDTSFHGWTRWAVLGVAAVAIAVLLAGLRRTGVVAALVAVLLTPAVWSAATAATDGSGGVMPAAGPSEPGGGFEIFANGQPPAGVRGGRQPMQGGPPGGGRGELTDEQKRILSYAKENSGGAEITLAVAGPAQMASPFIMGSDEVVIGMGGFSGSDNAPSVGQLQAWLTEGRLKFVLGGEMGGRGPGGRGDNGRQEWIAAHCSTVDPSAYGGGSAQLLECRA